MTGSAVRTLVAVPLMLSVLSGCEAWQMNGAIDRLKPDAAAHARALSENDVELMRETGTVLLSRLGAYADW